MRLGGPIFESFDDPDSWAAVVRNAGYRAAYCPVNPGADEAEIRAYERSARDADIVIAEVGAWSNPLARDEKTRDAAIGKCKASLAVADAIGARCCVNIAGSRGQNWHGPHPDDLTAETFEMIVQVVREIIDAVQPTRTFYTLEAMPWLYPDSPDSYLRLIEAIGRQAFAVHLDPVNVVSSPQRYFGNAALIRECFDKLGAHIKSCHAKDVVLSEKLSVHLDEVRPGLGGLDYAAYLREMDKLDADTPLMMEHLSGQEQYTAAAEYIRSVAAAQGIRF